MLYKTRGIVFQTVKYTDNSFIAKIYTELFGLQSFLVNSPRTKKSNTKINLFQPMNLVELVMYRKEKKQLQRIKEIKIEQPFRSIPFQNSKQSILLFINEVLYKSVKEEEPHKQLFDFVRQSVLDLDESENQSPNFHIHFLAHLASQFGFMPTRNFSSNSPFFDLPEGVFVAAPNSNCLSRQASEMLFAMLDNEYKNVKDIKMTAAVRREILAGMIRYFQIHLQGFGEIQSHRVLEEIYA